MSASNFIHNDSIPGEELPVEDVVVPDPAEVPPKEDLVPPKEGDEVLPEPHRKTGSQRARERAERAETEATRLRAELEAIKTPNPSGDQPKLEDFEDFAAWEAAMVSHVQAKTAKETKAAIQRELAEADAVKAQENWKRKDKEFAKDKPDFFDAVAELEDAYALRTDENTPTWQAINVALSNSDEFSAIKYYLGKNPQEIDRLVALAPIQAIKEMARIEDKLASIKPIPKPVSQAPAPPTPIPSGATSPPVRRRSDSYIHS